MASLETEIINEWENVLKIEAYSKLGILTFQNDAGKSSGLIDVIDDLGILWRTFKVKIEIPKNYPESPPKIYEIGDVIPKELDWHINYDGSCCVGPNAKVYRKLNNNITIKGWLDNVVTPYFLDQVHKIEHGFYQGKEYEHGAKGLLNDYKECWGLNNHQEVIEILKLITGVIKLGRNEVCFCGSGKKYKKCHLFCELYEEIPITVYKDDLKMIEFELRNNK